jgi:hypothetical protein
VVAKVTPNVSDVEIARRKMLFALLIEHEINSAKFHDLTALNSDHGIGMPATWVASSVAPWEQRGWVKKTAMLDGSVLALLLPSHYGDALELILGWLGARSLTVDSRSRCLSTDISPPLDLYLPPGWQWFQYADSVGQDEARVSKESRLILLSNDDHELAYAQKALSEAIEVVRADNGLEQRDIALSSLRYADELLGRVELTVLQIRVGLPMFFDDALRALSGWSRIAVVETAKAVTADWIRKRLGL